MRARSNNITCDVINTETRTEIPTVEPNTNDVRARSNVDEGSITVGNDSSNDTSIPALMGKIKTYSAVTNGRDAISVCCIKDDAEGMQGYMEEVYGEAP